jgi:transketolase
MKRHDSQRGFFAYELYRQMKKNKDIWLLTADLGFGMFDDIQADFPDRFVNTGAAEQSLIGIAVGLALEGKIVFCYSITPFLLYRPFEFIRNYPHHEKIPVKMVGSGRGKDYGADGFTHHCEEAKQVLDCLPNIVQYWPKEKEEVPKIVREAIKSNQPCFISLER